jgi:hypothetical protein
MKTNGIPLDGKTKRNYQKEDPLGTSQSLYIEMTTGSGSKFSSSRTGARSTKQPVHKSSCAQKPTWHRDLTTDVRPGTEFQLLAGFA